MRELILDPMGVLHDEPRRLLLDDLREIAQASSILALIGYGCHRMTEIAARLAKPATSLSRPMQRLVELGLVKRDFPFGAGEKHAKRTLYRIADPFILFWFRYVGPNRSRLEARLVHQVQQDIKKDFDRHVGEIWEELARSAVPRMNISGIEWSTARRWWGITIDGLQTECDVVSESADGKALLVGEVSLKLTARDETRKAQELRQEIRQLPFTGAYRRIVPVIFGSDQRSSAGNVTRIPLDDILLALT